MSIRSLKNLGLRMEERELAKASGLASGQINPWDLPEFQTARQNLLGERDVGMGQYLTNLTRSGVEGPAAALGLERYTENYPARLLDFSNQLRNAYTDRGLALSKSAWDRWYQMLQDYQRNHMARQAQPNLFTKITSGIQQGANALSSMADIGFGGAAMLGQLPGMEGKSVLANSSNQYYDLLIEELKKRLGK